MKINADFGKRAAVHTAHEAWVPSPMPGVERKMLDRIGEEVARATSIVRYAPGSAFSEHTHGGGEEFLVLEGTFQDEHGDYPAGTYVRNPPTSHHVPGSAEGCTIFVKLWQFDLQDRYQLSVDTNTLPVTPARDAPGISRTTLFRDDREEVRIESWQPDSPIRQRPHGGIEILCLDGGFEEGGETFTAGSWLRLPLGSELQVKAGPKGARIWLKEGHLRFANEGPADA